MLIFVYIYLISVLFHTVVQAIQLRLLFHFWSPYEDSYRCCCSRPEPVAGGSRSGGGKLGLLINKLHTFLAVSAEQGGEHSLPGHWSGERLICGFVSTRTSCFNRFTFCAVPGHTSQKHAEDYLSCCECRATIQIRGVYRCNHCTVLLVLVPGAMAKEFIEQQQAVARAAEEVNHQTLYLLTNRSNNPRTPSALKLLHHPDIRSMAHVLGAPSDCVIVFPVYYKAFRFWIVHPPLNMFLFRLAARKSVRGTERCSIKESKRSTVLCSQDDGIKMEMMRF